MPCQPQLQKHGQEGCKLKQDRVSQKINHQFNTRIKPRVHDGDYECDDDEDIEEDVHPLLYLPHSTQRE